MGIIAAVAGPTFKRYQTSAIIGDIRQRAEVFSKMQQIYFYKNGEFAWRSQLGLPPDPTNGGCGGCVDLSYLGPDVSDYVSSIYVAAAQWPSPNTCKNSGSLDIHFKNTLTGATFSVYGRYFYDGQSIQFYCEHNNDDIAIPGCVYGSWTHIFAASAEACS